MGEFSNDVFVFRSESYDVKIITDGLRRAFEALGVDLSALSDKNVVIKPNLVIRKTPDAAATTHPAVIDALLCLLGEAGIVPTIAESPGGVFSPSRLGASYRVCGIEEVAKNHGAVLNTDITSEKMTFDGAKTLKVFDIITPIAKADVIFDLCKLKSHSLTKMSAAAKNLYGTIPGITKFELHAAHPDAKDFTSMLCDLSQMLCTEKTVIAVTDAIIGMEGEGPTGGRPRKIGAVTVSKNPFAADYVSTKILGMEGGVPLVEQAKERGLFDAEKINVLGDGINEIKVDGFVLPKSQNMPVLKFFSEGRMGKFFTPRPKITDKCRGCGECAASCPQHTIKIVNKKAKINAKNCIKCYCCQELCPFVAIKIKRNPIMVLISKLR